jgi:aspartyl-tRNA(Asn)/glutamyl-tRNA(Gln) amidotransferase subunit A
MNDLATLSLAEALKGIRGKKFSSADITKSCLDKIEKTDGKIKAFLNVRKEAVKESENTAIGLLKGIPYAVKDVISTKGIETTAGSKDLKGYIPPYNATVVEKINSQGGVILGKTNCDAFAQGASGENSGYFPTHNPHDLDRVPGGSSSGSAAAVTANQTIFALGTDTGGSIRQPAAFCGIVGLKPTYGRCSRYGLIAMASSFDTPGPLTKTVEDAAIILNLMAGKDENDATSVNVKIPDYTKSLNKGLKGIKIGVVKEHLSKGLDPEIKKSVEDCAKKLEKQGAIIEDIHLPYGEYGIAVYYVLVSSEVSSNMARYDGNRFGYRSNKGNSALEKSMYSRTESLENEVKRRIMIGCYALSSGYFNAYYLQASKVRTLIINDFKKAFKKVDAILSPATPTTAFRHGEKIGDPLQMYLSDIYTVNANVAGIPGLVLPFSKDSKNLPIGVQLLGNHFEEEKLLQIGSMIEKIR